MAYFNRGGRGGRFGRGGSGGRGFGGRRRGNGNSPFRRLTRLFPTRNGNGGGIRPGPGGEVEMLVELLKNGGREKGLYFFVREFEGGELVLSVAVSEDRNDGGGKARRRRIEDEEPEEDDGSGEEGEEQGEARDDL